MVEDALVLEEKGDSEELEDGLAMGIAFSRLGFGYRYPYYGYRGYW